MKRTLVLTCGILTLALMTALPQASAALIEDAFTIDGVSPLDGRTSEIGSRTWTAGSLTVTEATWTSGVVYAGGAHAYAFVPFASDVPTSGTVWVEADLNFRDSSSDTAWWAVGFSDSVETVMYNSDLFVYLKRDGFYKLRQDKDTGTDVTGTATTVYTGDNESWNRVRLTYNIDAGKLSVTINGVEEISDHDLKTGFTPDVQYAGFGGESLGGKHLADNFKTDVPEPATMGLLGLGFAGMAVLRRRRRNK